MQIPGPPLAYKNLLVATPKKHRKAGKCVHPLHPLRPLRVGTVVWVYTA